MSSNLYPNVTHSQPQNAPAKPDLSDLAEFATLAEKLQETAQSLLAFRRQLQPENDHTTDNDTAGSAPTAGETRCYQLPGYILDEEREMLAFYKAGSWQELFAKAYEQFYATIMLMEHVAAEDEFDGFSLSLIAGNLMSPLRMLGRLCSLVADFHPADFHPVDAPEAA